MDRRQVQNGIFRAWKAIEKLELGETFSSGAPLPVTEEFRNLILNDEISYVTLYLGGLNQSHYNFLLSDYSYFQFSWSLKDCVRYAYYPNPFATGKTNIANFRQLRERVESGEIPFEEYLETLKGNQPEAWIPLIRYENAPSQHKELQHPCSHFHIGHHSDNRWAVNRLLTPLAFTLLILKHYYSSAWREHGDRKSVV